MAKTKTPFFGLGSQGSVGGTVTTQKRHQLTMVRSKPTPAYRHTLPQAYQRWLYEDYAYLWRQQTAVTQQQYATAGSRYHLTGFQYWMRTQLSLLPDIFRWYKLDTSSGAQAIDSSRNHVPGTIFGASQADGLIDGCLSFDGINDLLDTNLNSDNLPPISTFDFFFNPQKIGRQLVFSAFLGASPNRWDFEFDRLGTRKLEWMEFQTALFRESTTVFTIGTWYHVSITHDVANTTLTFRVNGVLDSSHVITLPLSTNTNLSIAERLANPGVISLEAYIDNFFIMNLLPDIGITLRHSERRYPA